MTRLTRRAVTGVAIIAMLGLAHAGIESAASAPAAAVTPGGVVWTWGANSFGELGDGTTQAQAGARPGVRVDDVVDLHGGREHVAALRDDGTVWVWGSNVAGPARPRRHRQPLHSHAGPGAERGHGGRDRPQPHAGAPRRRDRAHVGAQRGRPARRRHDHAAAQPGHGVGLDDAIAIAAGRNMSYALREDGTVVGWGRNDEGQLGDGTTDAAYHAGPRRRVDRRRRHRRRA